MAGPTSDDFSGSDLDGMWSLEGPGGSAALGAANGEAYVELVVPQGNFDPWGVNRSVRLVQAVADGDFGVEARFLSTPAAKYQMQGILVEQDADNWIRFDTHSDGRSLYVFAATTENGSSEHKISVKVGAGSAAYLRVERTGDTWELRYSADGQNWTTAGAFDHALNVSAVGPFAGATTGAPGYTAQVDYVFDTAAPILDEDQGVSTNAPPAAQDDVATTDADTPVVLSVAALLANDSDADGDPLQLTGFEQPGNGTVEDNGDGTLTYTPDAGFSGADGFDYTISDGTDTDTATVTLSVDDPNAPPLGDLNVWYGDVQRFGNPGEAQRWINILGNVAPEDLSTLSFSLNGGPDRPLSIGPDRRRLEDPGDFNIDLDYDELDGSATDDIIRIKAAFEDGSSSVHNVTVDYQSGQEWPTEYSIDWSQVSDIQAPVQVVDGLWDYDADGARPVQPGYDRMLALGDESWDNYEVTASVTVHEILEDGGFGFGLLWNGHLEMGDWQPEIGWTHAPAFFYRDDMRFHLYDWKSYKKMQVSDQLFFDDDSSYNFKVRVEQSNDFDRMYSIKVWGENEAEPTGWLIQDGEGFAAPATGGLYLLAHNSDVTFGDLHVTEIAGDDIIPGKGSSDVLVAVDQAQANPGRGEVDVLTGGAGSDVFVLGNANGSFYDDGDDSTIGTDDYGLIWDFDSGVDQIRLAGSMDAYTLADSPSELQEGTGIFEANPNGPDELIGIVNDVFTLSLSSNDFLFHA